MASATPDLRLPSQPMADTNLYCLVNRGTLCLCVNNLPRVVTWSSNLRPLGCKSDALTTTPLRHLAPIWLQLKIIVVLNWIINSKTSVHFIDIRTFIASIRTHWSKLRCNQINDNNFNSNRRLRTRCSAYTHAGHSLDHLFALCDLWPWSLTFWRGEQGIMIDCPCAKFDDFSFSRFGFIVRTDRQTESHTKSYTNADDRYTHVTITVGVSNQPCTYDSVYSRLETH